MLIPIPLKVDVEKRIADARMAAALRVAERLVAAIEEAKELPIKLPMWPGELDVLRDVNALFEPRGWAIHLLPGDDGDSWQLS